MILPCDIRLLRFLSSPDPCLGVESKMSNAPSKRVQLEMRRDGRGHDDAMRREKIKARSIRLSTFKTLSLLPLYTGCYKARHATGRHHGESEAVFALKLCSKEREPRWCARRNDVSFHLSKCLSTLSFRSPSLSTHSFPARARRSKRPRRTRRSKRQPSCSTR